MLSLVDQNPIMEANSQKLSNNNTQEAAELLGLSSSDSSPSFTLQAPKQKRKVRFKKPFRSHSRLKAGHSNAAKSCKCSFGEGFKIFSYFVVLAIVCALLWYVMTLSTRIQELQVKFSDFEAGNRNTPEALHVIHSNLKQLDSNVTLLYIEVRKNIAEIENITSEVKLLKETAASLKDSIAAAPAIQQLPKDMHSLSESVANFGSKMNALESNIKEIKDQQSNMQTTAQNLSGELDLMKVTVQDLTNSSDVQAKSLASPIKDAKMQSSVLETNQRVDNLKEQLMDAINSFDKLNVTCNSQLNAYNNMPDTVKTLKDAIMLINNTTILHDSRLLGLESAIHSNVTLRLEQLESERLPSFKKPEGREMEEYVNKTISEAILHLINKNIFQTDAQTADDSYLQSLEQTHDVLVLLATLLQKFEQIPKSYILSHKNATELVENMLLHAFEEASLSRDTKIEVMEQEIYNISLCIPNCHSHGIQSDSHLGDLTTPVFFQPTVTQKPDTVSKDNSEAQLLEALG